MSPVSKRKRTGAIITGILSFLFSMGPVIAFLCYYFYKATTQQRIVMGVVSLIILILVGIIALWKVHLRRTIFWMLVFTLFIACRDNMLIFVIIGAGNIIDELILSPLYKHFKTSYRTNREIDKRMEV